MVRPSERKEMLLSRGVAMQNFRGTELVGVIMIGSEKQELGRRRNILLEGREKCDGKEPPELGDMSGVFLRFKFLKKMI